MLSPQFSQTPRNSDHRSSLVYGGDVLSIIRRVLKLIYIMR